MKTNSITNKSLVAVLIAIVVQVEVFAQTADSIIRQFERYSSQQLQEKVFVHTDKSFYLTGEVIWFKVYVTDAVFHKPSDISKIAYVELINIESKAVLQAKIDINDGSGNGSLVLPAFLNSGNYTLRAYTNWMKNSIADYYFKKNLSIVNTSKNAGNASNSPSTFDVVFFPEGGQLVTGLPSTVAFRMLDKNGVGIQANGCLLNQRNDTLLRFSPTRFGIGRFNFVPVKGETYKAVIRYGKDDVVTKPLPPAYKEGFVMQANDADTGHVKVIVKSNIIAATTVYLFIHNRSRFKTMLQQPLQKEGAVFIIDKKTLEDGINNLTVFDDKHQPVCERLYFKRPAEKLDIDITTNQTVFSSRTKVDIDLFSHLRQTTITGADLSLSAFLIDSLQTVTEPAIVPYLLLASDLAGKVESQDWYFNNENAEADMALDNLMLTHGWRRFKWEEIQRNQKPYFEFLPELEGSLIKGKILNKRTGWPSPGITAFLSAPGQQFQFASAVSDSNGELVFNLKNFYGSRELIALTNPSEDSNYRVDLINSFSDKYAKDLIPPIILNEKWREQLRNRSLYTQVENAYLKPVKHRFIPEEEADPTHFFGKPDKTYHLDDYTRFTTMEEVMREFVAEVRVRKSADSYNFKVRRPTSIAYFDSDPLVLLDGVPVFNINKIIETDPLRIKNIDVVTHKYYAGSYVTDGIISYNSYEGELGGTQLDPNAVIVEFEGLQRQREFYSPMYTTSEQVNSPIPDFRNVLHWAPKLRTDETGHQKVSFYTSDFPGKYAIMVQGITVDGLAGSKMITIDVK